MKKFLLFSVIVWYHTLSGFAQHEVLKGRVQDSKTLEPIVGATVVLKEGMDKKIIAYTTTSDNGTFSLQAPPSSGTNRFLQVNCLGYAGQTLEVKNNQEYIIRMEEKTFVLDEVSVKARKIIRNQDTTTYFVSGFVTGKDRTIGDVLTNMPGINIAENGRITYNGIPINKFYIEGIDLFDGKYNLATNNISHKNIARVEIIENHQPIRALRNSHLDTETAINLKLKDNAKSTWNGNMLGKGGIAPETGLWEGGLFAARFASAAQSASTLKSNNSGKNISDEGSTLTIDDLLFMFPGSEIAGNLKQEPSISADISDDRTRFNQTHMFSNSSMWKLSEYSQIKTQILYTDDKNKFNQVLISSYYLSDSTLVKETGERSTVKNRTLQASFTATVDKEAFYLSEKLTYSSGWKTFASNISGDFSNRSIADIDRHHIENRLKYIKRSGNTIFQITSFNNYMLIPEELNVYAEKSRKQDIEKSNFYSNTNFKYVRQVKRWSLGVNAGFSGSIYDATSNYKENNDYYRNNLGVNHIGGHINPEISFQSSTLKLDIKFPVSFYGFRGEVADNKVFLKPELYLKWKITPRWTVFLNAALGNSYPGNTFYYIEPIMTDYRSMNAGFVNFTGKKEKRLGGRISYSNASEMLFANLSLTRSVENTKRTVLKQVTNDGIFYRYIPGSDIYKLWFADGSISKGIELIRGTVELRGSFQNHTMPILQNNQTQVFDFGNINASLSVTSGITDWMDINYKAGYKSNFIECDDFSSTTRHITQTGLLTLYPTENLHVKLNAAHYFTLFDGGQRKHTFITDAECVYKYKQFDLLASVSNLFNQRSYSYTLYGDLSSTYMQYDIRGRNILVGVSWYF